MVENFRMMRGKAEKNNPQISPELPEISTQALFLPTDARIFRTDRRFISTDGPLIRTNEPWGGKNMLIFTRHLYPLPSH